MVLKYFLTDLLLSKSLEIIRKGDIYIYFKTYVPHSDLNVSKLQITISIRLLPIQEQYLQKVESIELKNNKGIEFAWDIKVFFSVLQSFVENGT